MHISTQNLIRIYHVVQELCAHNEAGLMLSKASSFKRGCYACQWLKIVTCICLQYLIIIYHVVQVILAFSPTANERTDSHNNCSAHIRAVQKNKCGGVQK